MKKALLALTVFSQLVLSSAFGAEIQYQCFSYNLPKRENVTMDLTISGNHAKADIREEMWDDGHLGGAIDPKYRSRGAVKYVKFGTDLIVEESLLKGGKRLRDGSMGGFARAEGQIEGGFYQYKFVCRR